MLAILLLAILPHSPELLVDHVDILEINHVQCPQTGQVTLSQMIYWRWHDADLTHHVTAWRSLAGGRPSRLRRVDRDWVETWEDGRYRREIRAVEFRETWTFHDPEIADRERVGPDMRRGLKSLP